MDFSEREKLVRRISSRCLYGIVEYNNKSFNIVIEDPSLQILTESDFIYQNKFDEEKRNGDIITLEESYEILKTEGRWSNKLEKEADDIEKSIKAFTERLNTLGFHKREKNKIEKNIEKGKKRLEELNQIKNQLWDSTLEALCLRKKRHFLISKCTKGCDSEFLENPGFLNTIINLYYGIKRITLEQIRELARTDPWRLYWAMSKNTGNKIFPISLCEMSEFQYALCSWSRQYDFAFESTNRPDEETINNDIKFDIWYQKEISRIEKEINKSKAEASIENLTGSEIYIPTDIEGYKEVYGLNSEASRQKIAIREKAIVQSGELKEAQLPDVKQNIQMEINKMHMKQRN